jgi:hypothetical protein
MKRRLMMVMAIGATLVTTGAAGAAIHHGWGNYDSNRTLNLVGTLSNVRYVNPHVIVDLTTTGEDGRTWEAVLAPPSRMQARGAPASVVQNGITARVIGYPHLRIENEMRAERIVIGNDTTELR